jgi:hypothetical protein
LAIGAGIIPHIPVWDMSKRDDGTFSRSEFRYDRKRNVYICPGGEALTTSGRVNSDHAIRDFFDSIGPTLPTWALQQVGSYLENAGRDAEVAETVARDPMYGHARGRPGDRAAPSVAPATLVAAIQWRRAIRSGRH